MRDAGTALSLAARCLLAVALGLLVAGGAGVAALHVRGARLLSVQTASMVPAFRPGDALVVAPVSARYLRLGEIVSYRNPRNPNVTITHRLVAINKRTGWLTTAGDAYRSPDPSFPPGLLVGRAAAVAPGLGVVLDTLRRPIGLALAIYLPAGLIVAAEVRRLGRTYARPFYSAKL
jgi:signal peptidase I